MNRREKLLEQYEDAYFALLMDEVAEQEGARLEKINEELQDDPSADVPKQVDDKCLKVISRYFEKQRRSTYWRTAKHIFNQIAVLVTIMVMMFTTAFAFSEDFRVTTLNILISVEEKYTQVTMGETPLNSNASTPESTGNGDLKETYFSNLQIGWIPEGFSCTNYAYDSFAGFQDSTGLSFSISQEPGSSVLNVDTEDADSVTDISVNGLKGIKVVKEGRIHSVLLEDENEVFISVRTSAGIADATHEKILENIKFIK